MTAVPLLLISLSLGYFVFLYASREKNEVKTVGRLVGIVVIVLSLSGVLCSTVCMIKKGSCGMMKKEQCNMGSSHGKSAESCPMMGDMGKK